MIVLAVDTCLGACSTALIDADRVLASLSEPMTRGHQERLAPMVQEMMAKAKAEFSRVERIAVTVGPGSFTGLRVGIAFAKGLAIALDRPCIGVGSLQALAFGIEGRVIACIDARHGQVYWQTFDKGEAVTEAAVSSVADLPSQNASTTLVGPAAALLGELFPDAHQIALAAADPVSVARLGLLSSAAPTPLYLRPPDAKLPGGVTPQW